MGAINLFGLGQQGQSPNVTGSHRLNVYLQINQDADKCQINAMGTPGLVPFSTVSSSKTRAIHWLEANNMLYVVQGVTLWEITPLGNYTNRGTLNSADNQGLCSIANNGKQIFIATGYFCYLFNTTTGVFSEITSAMPGYGVAGTGVAGTVCFLDSYFIVNQVETGQFWVGNSYDGATWNPLYYATAESSPDNLQAVWSDKGHLVLIGTSSTEIWINTGALAFPYQRVQGAISQTGLEAKWSVANINGSLTALVRNKHGALSVAYLNGYIWTPISTPDIDFIFNNYQTPSDAVAFGYSINGRHFYQINFQAAAASWLFDFQSQAWSQLKSKGITRHLANLGCSFAEKYIVADYLSGALYQLSANAYTDNGNYIEREIIGKHVFRPSMNILSIRRLRAEFEGGIGLIAGQGLNPTVMLQISRDNGHTWGNELWTTIGMQGQYQNRAEWRRLGQSRDWLFKLRFTDPVKFFLMRAVIEGQELNR